MPADPLSDVLRVIRLSGGVFLRLHMSPPFGFVTKTAETLRQALDSDDSIAEVTVDIGYDSEASFNRAFKRHVGAPPPTWRRSKRMRTARHRR